MLRRSSVVRLLVSSSTQDGAAIRGRHVALGALLVCPSSRNTQKTLDEHHVHQPCKRVAKPLRVHDTRQHDLTAVCDATSSTIGSRLA